MFLFRPAWKSKNYKRAMKSIRRVKSQEKLVKVALEAEFSDVRVSAVNRLQSDHFLMQVARVSECYWTGPRAASRINDQSNLLSAAITGCTIQTKVAAAKRLAPVAAGLAAMNSPDMLVRLACIGSVTDQEVLFNIASCDCHAGRDTLKNIKLISDPEEKEKLILQDEDLRRRAAESIMDKTIANRLLARPEADIIIRPILRRGLADDQMLLSEFIGRCPDEENKKLACKLLTNETYINNCFKYEKNPEVQLELLDKVTDDSLIENAALTSDFPPLRQRAAGMITDEGKIKNMALNAKHAEVRRFALAVSGDSEIIDQLALNDPDESVRAVAVSLCYNQKTLESIAENENCREIRREAVRRLTSQELLSKYAAGDSDILVREAALRKVIDRQLLLDIFEGNDPDGLRLIALARLNDPELIDKVLTCGEYDHMFVENAISLSEDPNSVGEALAGSVFDNDLARKAIIRIGEIGSSEHAKFILPHVKNNALLADALITVAELDPSTLLRVTDDDMVYELIDQMQHGSYRAMDCLVTLYKNNCRRHLISHYRGQVVLQKYDSPEQMGSELRTPRPQMIFPAI